MTPSPEEMLTPEELKEAQEALRRDDIPAFIELIFRVAAREAVGRRHHD